MPGGRQTLLPTSQARQGDEALSLTIARLTGTKAGEGPPLIGRGHHDAATSSATLGSRNLFYEVSHAAAEIEVDEETGRIELRRYASVSDVGRALNPALCEGQDIGAALMGIGHTLLEELVYVDGALANGNLVEYAVPSTADLPTESFVSVLLENNDGPGPFGAKGIGEGGILGAAPAIANALEAATGLRVRELPLNPERVWRLLRARRGGVTGAGGNGVEDVKRENE